MSQTLAPVGPVYSIRGYGDWLILFESTLWKWRNAIMFSSVSDIALQLFIFVLFTLFTAATGAMLWCNCFKLASGFMVLINHLSSFCLCVLWEALRGALSTCLGEPAPRQLGQMAPRVTHMPSLQHLSLKLAKDAKGKV